MKHKTKLTKSRKLKIAERLSVRGFTTNKTLLAISIISAVVIIGGLIYFFKPTTSSPMPNTNTVENVKPSPVTTTSNIEWKTYTNTEAGFSFKYPANISINQEPADESTMNLLINAEKLADIEEDLPMMMGRNDAIKEKTRLSKGEGDEVVKIGPIYGQTETILSQFEVCSVILSRKITFYPNDYRVIISLRGPKSKIIEAMPEYFTIDEANCGSNKVWNREKLSLFESTLAKKQGKGIAQEWFNTLDSIIKTIEISAVTPKAVVPTTTQTVTTDEKTVPEGWLTYTNSKYGFEISYPKSYKALDDKENLYGYPNGAVLLYDGGQAYDVIIEAWDKESDYKNNYPGMLNDIKVVKSNGKFITIFAGTNEPDNKKIVESFKLK